MGPFSLSSLLTPDVAASAPCSSSLAQPGPPPPSQPGLARHLSRPQCCAVNSLPAFQCDWCPREPGCWGKLMWHSAVPFCRQKRRGEKLAESKGFCCWVSVAAIYSSQAFAFPFGCAFLAQCWSSRAVFLRVSRCP